MFYAFLSRRRPKTKAVSVRADARFYPSLHRRRRHRRRSLRIPTVCRCEYQCPWGKREGKVCSRCSRLSFPLRVLKFKRAVLPSAKRISPRETPCPTVRPAPARKDKRQCKPARETRQIPNKKFP